MKDIDNMLYKALAPTLEPDPALNRNIIEHSKEAKMDNSEKSKRKHFPAAAAITIAVLILSSVTAYAAWRHLNAVEIAEKVGDERLSSAFEDNNLLKNSETQSFGNIDVTLLGVVSGNEISDQLSKDDAGNVDGDKTYIAVAISHNDGTPMPDVSDPAFDMNRYFVSPYIKGIRPDRLNSYYLGGGATGFVSDGIEYRLAETDNIEIFADRGIYIGVSDGIAYNSEAYNYDRESGELTRNSDYNGVNALFILDMGKEKADPEKAQEILDGLELEGGGDISSTFTLYSEQDMWVNSITPDNIDEKAVPVESSRKTMTIEEFYREEFGSYPEDLFDNIEDIVMEEYFKDGVGMSEAITRCAGDWDDTWVETYTLNEDKTITRLRYVPKDHQSKNRD